MSKGIYIVSRLYPNNNGGTQHNYGLCCVISQFMDLEVYSMLEPAYSKKDADNEFLGERFQTHFRPLEKPVHRIWARLSLLIPADEGMLSEIREKIRKDRVDTVFFTIQMYAYFAALRKEFPDLRYIYISHNSEYLNIRGDLENYDREHNVSFLRHQSKIVRMYGFMDKERKALHRTAAVFSISRGDIDKLSQHYRVDRSRFIFSKPMIRYTSPRPENAWKDKVYGHALLIVGNMSWYPTAQGAEWFAREVFPALRAKDPMAKLFVVGAKPSKKLEEIAKNTKGITVTGFVDSVDEYYEKCDIAVVPVFEGTGAKIKVLEACGKHIPAVISAFTARDYEGIEKVVFTAQDRDSFIDACWKLMTSEEERGRMTEALVRYYEDYMADTEAVGTYLETTDPTKKKKAIR